MPVSIFQDTIPAVLMLTPRFARHVFPPAMPFFFARLRCAVPRYARGATCLPARHARAATSASSAASVMSMMLILMSSIFSVLELLRRADKRSCCQRKRAARCFLPFHV